MLSLNVPLKREEGKQRLHPDYDAIKCHSVIGQLQKSVIVRGRRTGSLVPEGRKGINIFSLPTDEPVVKRGWTRNGVPGAKSVVSFKRSREMGCSALALQQGAKY